MNNNKYLQRALEKEAGKYGISFGKVPKLGAEEFVQETLVEPNRSTGYKTKNMKPKIKRSTPGKTIKV